MTGRRLSEIQPIEHFLDDTEVDAFRSSIRLSELEPLDQGKKSARFKSVASNLKKQVAFASGKLKDTIVKKSVSASASASRHFTRLKKSAQESGAAVNRQLIPLKESISNSRWLSNIRDAAQKSSSRLWSKLEMLGWRNEQFTQNQHRYTSSTSVSSADEIKDGEYPRHSRDPGVREVALDQPKYLAEDVQFGVNPTFSSNATSPHTNSALISDGSPGHNTSPAVPAHVIDLSSPLPARPERSSSCEKLADLPAKGAVIRTKVRKTGEAPVKPVCDENDPTCDSCERFNR